MGSRQDLEGKVVMVTGGTGSFGKAFIAELLQNHRPSAVRVFSRDELKQHELATWLKDDRVRYLIGDVRDRERLERAMRGVNIVIHAAALKHVPICETRYEQRECVKRIPYCVTRMEQHVERRCVPTTVCRIEQQECVKQVCEKVCRMVEQECVKRVPVTVCKTVAVEMCEKVPYTVCKKVPYTACQKVPVCVKKMVPYTYTENVCKTIYKKVPYVVCVNVPEIHCPPLCIDGADCNCAK